MVNLSGRQYALLRQFAHIGRRRFLRVADAKRIDQRPFRSLLIRGYVDFVRDQGFYITLKGLEAWHMFQHTDIARKNPRGPLTSYVIDIYRSQRREREIKIATDNRELPIRP